MTNFQRYFVYVVITAVAASVIAGFFIVGSPQEERFRRFDAQRIQDLQYLQSQIVQYWQGKGRLPEELSLLRDDLRGVTLPVDPKTGESYVYEVRGALAFSLCASFARPSLGSETGKSFPVPAYPAEPYLGIRGGDTWEHGTGDICFERIIDPDFFKQVK